MTAMNEDVRKTCALVVEDDPNIVDLIRSNLAVRGFDTVVSVDGMRALQLLETEDVGDVYKFDFLAGNSRLRAFFAADGTFIGDEVR